MNEPLTEPPFTITDGTQRHAVYAKLAAAGPIHRIALPTGEPAWLLTGYEETRQALRDPRLVKSSAALANIGRGLLSSEMSAAVGSHMMNSDPPDHTRLRRVVAAAFTRRRTEQLAPRIQQITDELLDKITPAAQVDLIDSFAYPLPITVICELLGVPADRRADFHQWSSVVVTEAHAGSGALDAASGAIVDYLRELIDAKRAAPAEDLLSALVTVHDGEERLSENELTAMVSLILIAGHETTVNLIGNGVLALLTHPEQLTLLRAQPHQLPEAVEELLRFNGPLQVATLRWTAEPVDIAGITIPAGEVIIPGLLAANRDPAFAAQPNTVNIARTDNAHLAFGHGIHHCLGAPLAQLEGRIALSTLLARFPRLRLAVPAEQLTWRPGMLINGLDTLPVILR